MLLSLVRGITLIFSLSLALGVTSLAAAEEPAFSLSSTYEKLIDHYVELDKKEPKQALAILLEAEQTGLLTSPLEQQLLKSYISSAYLNEKNYDLAKRYADEIVEDATRNGDLTALANGLTNQISYFAARQQSEQALALIPKALDLLDKIEHKGTHYFVNNVVAYVYQLTGRMEQSLQHYQRIVEFAELKQGTITQRVNRQLGALSNMITLHLGLKEWQQAITVAQRGIAIATEHKMPHALGSFYINLGYAYGEMGDQTKAEQYFRQALSNAKQFNRIDAELISLNNLGDSLVKQKKHNEAKLYLEQALEQAKSRDDIHLQRLLGFNIAMVKGFLGDTTAPQTMLATIAEYKKAEHFNDLQFMYIELADVYHAQSQFKLEAETLREAMVMTEQLFAQSRADAISGLQQQYEAEAKAKQIELLEKDNALKESAIEAAQLQQMVSALAVVLTLIILILLTSFYRKVRNNNRALSQLNKQLAEQSQKDPLTGLANRRAFQHLMETRPTDAKPHALFLLDIDLFKQINDYYGHSAGDAVLIEVGKRLQQTVRSDDVVVRWGGEEFLIYIADAKASDMTAFCQRVLNCLADEPVQYEDKAIRVTTSLGFIHWPFQLLNEQEFTWEHALQVVDMALYISKVNGRNQGHGVLKLHGQYSEVESLFKTDLNRAIQQNVVDVAIVHGSELKLSVDEQQTEAAS